MRHRGFLHPNFRYVNFFNYPHYGSKTPPFEFKHIKGFEIGKLARNTRRQYASFNSLEVFPRTRYRSATSLVGAQLRRFLAIQLPNDVEVRLVVWVPLLVSTRELLKSPQLARIADIPRLNPLENQGLEMASTNGHRCAPPLVLVNRANQMKPTKKLANNMVI